MGGSDKARAERARATGLFRYALIREAADSSLSGRQRGAMLTAIAGREHLGPDGVPRRVSRASLDRWVKAWREGGFDALVPPERLVQRRTPGQVLDLAVALKKEIPERTAAQVARIMTASGVIAPSERTLQRVFAAAGLESPGQAGTDVFGRFEASGPNELWVGDALHGPTVAGRVAVLFAFLDDHTRLATGYRWVRREDTVRAETALRAGIAARGIPKVVYLDNGAPFVDGQLAGTLARLGVRLTHSKPHRPQGRGKIERFFRTVRQQFLVEVGSGAEITDIAELNRYFTAWVEMVYHPATHSETGQSPLQRWDQGWATLREQGISPTLASPSLLHDAFLWAETRLVTKTATVSLHSNTYQVDPALAGARIELIFDPFDLSDITVRYQHTDFGKAIPFELKRHCHPKARPDEATPAPITTGIDYLALVKASHEAHLAGRISYAELYDDLAGLAGTQDTDPPAGQEHTACRDQRRQGALW